MEKKERLENALKDLKELAPDMYALLSKGFYKVLCNKTNDVEKIQRIIDIYLSAKGIKVTPRPKELLVMYLKYDTSTKSREKISKIMKMERGNINVNTQLLAKLNLIVYPYPDTKKSKVTEDLLRLKDYMMKEGEKNILISYA